MSKKERPTLKQQQAINAQKKHEDSIKYMYFSRYLMVRYFVTILFFANLFWLIFCLPYHNTAVVGLVVSLVMTIYTAVVVIEQLTKMHNRKPDIPITRIYLWVQIGVNAVLALLEFTVVGKMIFPFVTTENSKWLIEVILLAGILMCIACEIKIHKINTDRDSYRKVIDTFEKNRQ